MPQSLLRHHVVPRGEGARAESSGRAGRGSANILSSCLCCWKGTAGDPLTSPSAWFSGTRSDSSASSVPAEPGRPADGTVTAAQWLLLRPQPCSVAPLPPRDPGLCRVLLPAALAAPAPGCPPPGAALSQTALPSHFVSPRPVLCPVTLLLCALLSGRSQGSLLAIGATSRRSALAIPGHSACSQGAGG